MLHEILKPYMSAPKTLKQGISISNNLQKSGHLVFVTEGAVLIQHFAKFGESVGIVKPAKTWLGLDSICAAESELITQAIAYGGAVIQTLPISVFNQLMQKQLKPQEADILKLINFELSRQLTEANELWHNQSTKDKTQLILLQIQRLSKIFGKQTAQGTQLEVTANLLSRLTGSEPESIRKRFCVLYRSGKIIRTGATTITLLG